MAKPDAVSSFFYFPIWLPTVSFATGKSLLSSRIALNVAPHSAALHATAQDPNRGDERASVDAALLRPFAHAPFLTTPESNPGDLWPPVNEISTSGIAFGIGVNLF
jgi:hypothetical protein